MKKLTKILFLILLLNAIRYPLSATHAAVPHLINYQGRLTDSSGAPLNGSYNLTFRIYDAETAGNLLWEETHSGVVIQKGIFSVLLGSVTNLGLAFDKPYWLEIKVGNDAPMTPRQQITSAGYAITAENGVPRGVIVMWSGKISDIPSGWALCDGTNGTPDLRNKFIVGAKQDDGGVAKTNVSGSLTQSGGSATKNLSHTHSVPRDGWGDGPSGALGRIVVHSNTYAQATNDNTSGSGGNSTQDILNPYYALAYIMKL